MFAFFLKKSFCDAWDNLLFILLFNVMLMVIAAGVFLGMGWLANYEGFPLTLQMVTSLGLGVIGVLLVLVFTFSYNSCAKEIAFYKAPPLKSVFTGLKGYVKDALFLAVVIVALVLVVVVGIPFYLGLRNILGLFLAAVLFWVVLLSLLALQWLMPLRAQLGDDPFLKSLKKCFLLTFDNIGFTIAMFIYTLVLLAVSVFTLGVAPGILGLLVEWNVALKLRMYKYDWIEAHPEVPAKEVKNEINWYELLEYDRDTIGPRPLKSFIFPWK